MVFNRCEDQPLVSVPNRINLQMCVYVFLVERWTSKIIAIGIESIGFVFIAHVRISSFADRSFQVPVGPIIQPCPVARLGYNVANLQHVIPIIVDPEIVELPVVQLKYDFGPHDESAVHWLNVLNSNLKDRTILKREKRAKASLPVPSDDYSTVGVLRVLSIIGRIMVWSSVLTRSRKCVGQVYIAVDLIGRRAVVYTRLR